MKRELELENKILEAKKAYYIENKPFLSDEEYDNLEDELRLLNPNSTVLKMTGIDIKDKNLWPVRSLSERMGTLSKVKSLKEFYAWNKFGDDLIINPKADGYSIQLEYKNGTLISAITRGDGYNGEDILDNVLKMQNVKKNIDSNENIILKGEIIVTFHDFQKIKDSYKNPRNAVAISKSKDGRNCQYLTILYYDISINGVKIIPKNACYEIKKLGLKCLDVLEFEKLENLYQELQKNREYFGFEIDGFVLKQASSEPIYNGNSPENQIAVKLPAQSAIAKIKSYNFRKSRTGRINIVICFEKPIYIFGSKITKASAGSWQNLVNNKFFPGAIVEVIRSNDVIPYITKVLTHAANELNLNDIKILCNYDNIYINGAHLWTNDIDDETIYNEICNIFNILEIKHISGSSIRDIIDFYKIKEIYEIFDIDFNKLINVEGWGEKKIQNLKSQLKDKANQVDLQQFIRMLNISNLGQQRIVEILNSLNITSIDDFLNLSFEKIIRVDGIQEKLANTFVDGINNKKEIAKKLLERISISNKSNVIVSNNKLNNSCFSITGKTRIKRAQLEKIIIENGGKNTSISKANYLITNDGGSGSNKNKQAQKLGVKIISEDNFLKMIN